MGTWTPGPGPTTGNDTYVGDGANDNVNGGDGNDTLIGAGGNDTLTGGAGNDLLAPGAGIDTVTGGDGDDAVALAFVNAGDVFNGNAGVDKFVIFDGPADPVLGIEFVNLSLATITSFQAIEFTTTSFSVVGISSTQLGTGFSNGATIIGGAAQDAVAILMQSAGVADLAALTAGWTLQNWTDGTDFLALFGSNGADTYTGTARGDYLNGEWDGSVGFGNDVLSGLGGNDVLEGWGGRDELYGGDGDDTLTGWREEWTTGEVINGGAGNDTLGVGIGEALTVDFRSSTITSIEALDLSKDDEATGSGTVRFLATQIGSGLSSTLAVKGLGATGTAVLIDVLGGSVDVSGWTFTDWNSVTDWYDSPEGVDLVAIQGGDGADTITGSSQADAINGEGGGVHVDGAGAADTIHGGDGNDLIDGWAGADQVYGEEGDDIIQIYEDETAADELADGGNGVDTLELHGEIDLTDVIFNSIERLRFVADEGPNAVTFTAAQTAMLSTTLEVNGDAAALSFVGTSGADTITISGWGFEVGGGPFVITMSGGAGTDNLIGGTLGDTLFGEGDYDYLYGQGGDDILWGGDDGDYLNGGDGNDTLHAGGDSLFNHNTLIGGAGADILNGGAGVDYAAYVSSSAGVTVRLNTGLGSGGEAAGDVLTGIEGAMGSDFNDTLIGNDGANYFVGNNGDDVLRGGGGADNLTGGDGNDRLEGGAGADMMTAGAGADQFLGGAGVDTVEYFESAAAVTVRLTGSISGGDAAGDTIVDVENIFGSSFDDILAGSALGNILEGGSGNDTIYGYDGADILGGGDGNDTLEGGLGADTLSGGGGVDTVRYVASASGVTVDIRAQTASGGDAAGDVLVSIENVIGSNFNDTFNGADIAETIDARAGDDFINGRLGDDTLIGGGGNDRINGGLGNDTLTGGGNSDEFVFGTALGASNVDAITDYNVSLDTIRLEDAVFTGLSLGVLAAGAFRIGAAAADADDRIIYNASTGALLFDADGTGAGAAVQFATLSAGLVLTNADFVVF